MGCQTGLSLCTSQLCVPTNFSLSSTINKWDELLGFTAFKEYCSDAVVEVNTICFTAISISMQFLPALTIFQI